MNTNDLHNIEIDGIDTKDYPDFSDAFICYAEYKDGTPLTDAELDTLNDENGDFVHEKAHESLYA